MNSDIRFLFPSSPLNKKKPDEMFEEEFLAMQGQVFSCSLFSIEEFEVGNFKPRPLFQDGEVIIYRGWMLTPLEYARLQAAIHEANGKRFTSSDQYRHTHWMSKWYTLCEDLTPKTIFLKKEADFIAAVAPLGWSSYFVKDYVKSLTTSRGSVARTPEEIGEIVSLLENFRGHIEGGVCIRQFEELCPETERRFFAIRGRVFAREGDAPEITETIVERIDSPFFAIDIVMARNGIPRLIELGDGQVSDRKEWSVARFVEIWTSLEL